MRSWLRRGSSGPQRSKSFPPRLKTAGMQRGARAVAGRPSRAPRSTSSADRLSSSRDRFVLRSTLGREPRPNSFACLACPTRRSWSTVGGIIGTRSSAWPAPAWPLPSTICTARHRRNSTPGIRSHTPRRCNESSGMHVRVRRLLVAVRGCAHRGGIPVVQPRPAANGRWAAGWTSASARSPSTMSCRCRATATAGRLWQPPFTKRAGAKVVVPRPGSRSDAPLRSRADARGNLSPGLAQARSPRARHHHARRRKPIDVRRGPSGCGSFSPAANQISRHCDQRSCTPGVPVGRSSTCFAARRINCTSFRRRSPTYRADNWWRTREGTIAYPSEFAKLVFYWFYYGSGAIWAGSLLAGSLAAVLMWRRSNSRRLPVEKA